jgi:hypothetical protein
MQVALHEVQRSHFSKASLSIRKNRVGLVSRDKTIALLGALTQRDDRPFRANFIEHEKDSKPAQQFALQGQRVGAPGAMRYL